jgi:hypothetical protein
MRNEMQPSKGLIRLLSDVSIPADAHAHLCKHPGKKTPDQKIIRRFFQKDNWPPLALIYGTAFSTYSLIESLLSLTCNQFFIFVKSLPVCLRLAEPKTTTV